MNTTDGSGAGGGGSGAGPGGGATTPTGGKFNFFWKLCLFLGVLLFVFVRIFSILWFLFTYLQLKSPLNFIIKFWCECVCMCLFVRFVFWSFLLLSYFLILHISFCHDFLYLSLALIFYLSNFSYCYCIRGSVALSASIGSGVVNSQYVKPVIYWKT